MSTEQNKNTIQRLFTEAMNGRNFDILGSIIAPEFVNHGIPNAERGPEGFRNIIQQFLEGFPDMNIRIENIISEGDYIATRGTWTGTNQGSFMGIPASGKKVTCTFNDFWKLQNGKCVENWVNMDIVGVMQQIGAIPANAEPAHV